jgi:hypothetical protein
MRFTPYPNTTSQKLGRRLRVRQIFRDVAADTKAWSIASTAVARYRRSAERSALSAATSITEANTALPKEVTKPRRDKPGSEFRQTRHCRVALSRMEPERLQSASRPLNS